MKTRTQIKSLKIQIIVNRPAKTVRISTASGRCRPAPSIRVMFGETFSSILVISVAIAFAAVTFSDGVNGASSTTNKNELGPQRPPDVNFFDQLNAFIQSRARNASEISENVFFKYYNQ